MSDQDPISPQGWMTRFAVVLLFCSVAAGAGYIFGLDRGFVAGLEVGHVMSSDKMIRQFHEGLSNPDPLACDQIRERLGKVLEEPQTVTYQEMAAFYGVPEFIFTRRAGTNP